MHISLLCYVYGNYFHPLLPHVWLQCGTMLSVRVCVCERERFPGVWPCFVGSICCTRSVRPFGKILTLITKGLTLFFSFANSKTALCKAHLMHAQRPSSASMWKKHQRNALFAVSPVLCFRVLYALGNRWHNMSSLAFILSGSSTYEMLTWGNLERFTDAKGKQHCAPFEFDVFVAGGVPCH